MTEHVCPSCHCLFKQEFLCTTCGAEKLKDEATKQLERALHSKSEALMMQTNEIERLRYLLQNGSPIVEGTIQHMAMQLATVTKERDELVAALKNLHRDGVRSYYTIDALAKLGADKEAT